jgi:polyhydroxybutyrate depolymerase
MIGSERKFSMQRSISVLALLACSCAIQDVNAQAQAPAPGAPVAERATVVVDGQEREYFVQAGRQTAAKRPVIFVLHGGTRSADDILSRSSWPSVAAREGALLIVPNAVGGNWNDGRTSYLGGSDPTSIDDVAFLKQLIKIAVRNHGGDPSRVYFTGASNGGTMSWRMACEAGSQVAAIAPVIATMPLRPARVCGGARPMPVVAFFGTEDPLMHYDGSAFTLGRRTMEARSSAAASTTFWARLNGCSDRMREVRLPDVSRADQTTVTRVTYQGCPAGLSVIRYDVIGGGHNQPGSEVPRRLGRLLGKGNQDIDAVELSWSFFQRHAR